MLLFSLPLHIPPSIRDYGSSCVVFHDFFDNIFMPADHIDSRLEILKSILDSVFPVVFLILFGLAFGEIKAPPATDPQGKMKWSRNKALIVSFELLL